MSETSPVRTATVRQLAYKLKGAGDPVPRFSFFLGAGASADSGIPLAGSMMDEFRRAIIQEQCPADITDIAKQREWLCGQPWYKAAEGDAKRPCTLYSELFERYESKDRGRQIYIERMIRDKKPSFGYVVLANLIARNYINTVITTNFDDLVNEACATFTEARPVTYAYGIMVSDLRIANPRPRILKLHGDYLYSRLKNSPKELSDQDANMSRYVPLLLNEYGLVVVGYSGCDESVMKLLEHFPPGNDLYWCGLPISDKRPLADPIDRLLRKTDGMYVEIESFDKMMSDIRSIVGFDVPKMLGSLSTRENQIIDQLQDIAKTSLNIKGVGALLREICEFRQADIHEREFRKAKDEARHHWANAIDAWQENDFSRAETELRLSLDLDPNDLGTRMWLGGVLTQWGRYAEAEKLLREANVAAPPELLAEAYSRLAYLYLVQGRWKEALENSLNLARISEQSQPRIRAVALNGAGVAYLGLGQHDAAIEPLKQSAELDPFRYYAAFNLATVYMVKNDELESRRWWGIARSLFKIGDWIDFYNEATIDVCLGDADQAIAKMRNAIANGHPGLASLALRSVRFIESAPVHPPAITVLREILEEAAVGEGENP